MSFMKELLEKGGRHGPSPHRGSLRTRHSPSLPVPPRIWRRFLLGVPASRAIVPSRWFFCSYGRHDTTS